MARLKQPLFGALLAVVLLLAGSAAQSELILVTAEQNGEFPASSYTLQEDDFHHPRLELLRSREKLDEVVAPAATQFETILRLRSWARRQWESSDDFYYPPWDAVEILDLARNHDNRGFCAQYAIVFLQACQSLGIHARYVDLPGHFAVAVWSDDYDRWVLMDPSNDLYYERDGLPMRGRDLHRAYLDGAVGGIVQVDSQGRRRAVSREELASYRLYSIDMAADQISRPVEVKVNGRTSRLVHATDYRTYPRFSRDSMVLTSDFLAWKSRGADASSTRRPETQDPDEFRYALNQTIVFMANERLREGIVKVALLSSNSPTFQRFLIRADGGTAWVPSPSPTVKWLLHPGMNQLYARVETSFGWKGKVSSIRVFYKPPLFASLPAFRGNLVTLLWHRPT
jgi:hypothetical protein